MKANLKNIKKLAELGLLKYDDENLKKDLEYIKNFDKEYLNLLNLLNLDNVKITNFPINEKGTFLTEKENKTIELNTVSENLLDNFVVIEKEIKSE